MRSVTYPFTTSSKVPLNLINLCAWSVARSPDLKGLHDQDPQTFSSQATSSSDAFFVVDIGFITTSQESGQMTENRWDLTRIGGGRWMLPIHLLKNGCNCQYASLYVIEFFGWSIVPEHCSRVALLHTWSQHDFDVPWHWWEWILISWLCNAD